MDVVIYMDKVVLEGKTIERPDCISRMQWEDLWEEVKTSGDRKCKVCGSYS